MNEQEGDSSTTSGSAYMLQLQKLSLTGTIGEHRGILLVQSDFINAQLLIYSLLDVSTEGIVRILGRCG